MNTTTPSNAALIAELTLIGTLVTRYILLVMIILSLFGNILNILVFCQAKMRSSPCTIYLLASACFNLLWTVDAVVPRFLSTYNLDFSAQISRLCKVRHYIFYTFSSVSVWMMTLATFDRFLISSKSVKYRQFSSFKNAYRMIGVVTIILCCNYSNLIYCANISGTPPTSSCTSITSKICGFYNEISRIMTVAIIPGSVIFAFGLGTIRHLKSLRTAVGPSSTEGAQPQFKMRKTDQQLMRVINIKEKLDLISFLCLKMLIGQIVLIFISWIPHAAERLYVVITLYDVKTPLRTAQDNFLDQIMWIVTTFDSSLSFYVYLFTGGILFRQTLRQMFGRVAAVTGATTVTDMSVMQRRTIN